MESIWQKSTDVRKREALQKRKNLQDGAFGQESLPVQTLVIGAGMAGILTAYFLQKRGQQVVVVEAKRIASGQTGRTTAKITSQHGMIYEKLIRRIGREEARAYAQANEAAIRKYEQIVTEENIDCHFEKLPSYLYSMKEEGIEPLKKEAQAATALGFKAHFVEGVKITELPYEVSGAVCFENQAQFHPLEFIKHLAEDIVVYENTKVLSVKKHRVVTNRGTIEADNIVFATHYPFINVPGFYFLRQHQERSYVLALNGQKVLSGMYYSIDENGLSLRSAGDILLLGGGKHRTGKDRTGKHRTDKHEPGKINGKNSAESGVVSNDKRGYENGTCMCVGYSWLRKMAQKYYPNAEEAGAWSAQDCMPHDEMPFIGKYSIMRPYWYVATGFHKWGMTSAMVAAEMISNLICGDFTPQEDRDANAAWFSHENIFTPQRLHFRAAAGNLMLDIGESILGLSKGLFSSKERRCPHMGCRLEWNAEERSWDCPCHGSRFDSTGELLDNPAQVDKKIHSERG